LWRQYIAASGRNKITSKIIPWIIFTGKKFLMDC
jgi:hypothetical protein